MLELIKGTSLLLRFLLELCALGALGYWGFKTGGGWITKFGLGIGAPLVTAVVWGTFLASPGASEKREAYRGGPTNSESYFSFISATVLPRPALRPASVSCSVRNWANSSKDRSKPPGM